MNTRYKFIIFSFLFHEIHALRTSTNFVVVDFICKVNKAVKLNFFFARDPEGFLFSVSDVKVKLYSVFALWRYNITCFKREL